MNYSNYVFKTASTNTLFDISWENAQDWCNFVLFKPTWLPAELTETSNKIRAESWIETSSHRAEFHDSKRSLSIKQFLYDWAPPAYDHPCLWRNAKISTPETTPLPKARNKTHSIQYPPKLADQECHYTVQKNENGQEIYHAWSKMNDNGSHTLVCHTKNVVINCIIKPAAWTTLDWARKICTHVML